jgi:hypothetical protein
MDIFVASEKKSLINYAVNNNYSKILNFFINFLLSLVKSNQNYGSAFRSRRPTDLPDSDPNPKHLCGSKRK